MSINETTPPDRDCLEDNNRDVIHTFLQRSISCPNILRDKGRHLNFSIFTPNSSPKTKMNRQKNPIAAALCLMLVCTLLPGSEARRGRGGGGFGRGGGGGYSRGWGGQSYRPAPVQVQRSGPSAGKVAGAAAAGAIGGAMIGSALSRPGYGYGYGGYGGHGGYGGYGGYGPGYGSPQFGGGYRPRPGYEPEGSGDMEYNNIASSGPIYNSIVVVIGFITSLLMGNLAAVM